MLTEILTWLLSWVPPYVVAGLVVCRLTKRPYLRAVGVWYGAMLYACAVAMAVAFSPGRFTPASVMVLSVAGALVAVMWAWRTRPRRSGGSTKSPIASAGPPALPERKRRRVTATGLLTAVLVFVLAAIGVWVTGLSFLLPPHFADAVATHCLAPMAWFYDKAFSWPVKGFSHVHDNINGYIKLPAFLFYYNVMGPGTQNFMSMAQWQGLILTMLATFAIVRQMGGERNAALLATLGIFSAPEISIQVLDTYLDMMVLGALIVVLLGLVLLVQKPGRRSAGFFSLACAAAVAWKAPNLPQILPVWVGGCAWVLWHQRRQMMRPRLLLMAAEWVALMATLGGFFYWLTWIKMGNPLYPFELKIAGRVLFAGAFDTSVAENFLLFPEGLTRWTAIPISWGERVTDTSLGNPFSGFGPMYVVLGLPAALVGFMAALRRHRADVGWFIVAMAAMFIFHPSRWQPRYTLFLVPSVCVALGWLWQQGARPFKALLGSAIALGALAGFARSLPYQPSGFLLPPVYWKSTFANRQFAELGSRLCLPDARPVQQKLMLHPDFAGKTIMADTKMGAGSLARRKMDSRLCETEFRNEPHYLQKLWESGAGYLYVTENHDLSRGKVLEVVKRHPRVFKPVMLSSPDVRLQTAYLSYPGSREHLFEVNREALQVFSGSGETP